MSARGAEIELVNGNGVVQGAQYRAIFSEQLTDANGALDLLTPAGDRLVTRPVGIALTEVDTGRSVFLAEVKETDGVLFDAHTFVYPEAFDQYKATISIRSRLSGVESDVILQERIDRALIQEFGINPLTARIEVWHEVITKPEVKIDTRQVPRPSGVIDQDQTIHLRDMSIGSGFAFHLAAPDNPLANQTEIAVTKELFRADNVEFLIESVPFIEAEGVLATLPAEPQARVIDKDRLQRAFADALRARPATASSRDSVSVLQIGKHRVGRPVAAKAYMTGKSREGAAELNGPAMAARLQTRPTALKGFLIDFPVVLTTQTNFTFKGDTTYWVTNDVSLSGTTTLEGGAIIKFSDYTSLSPVLRILGDLNCQTSPYNVAIFTAEDDDTVGERINGSTGVPATSTYYGWFNLWFQSSGTNALFIHDIHSRYSHVGFGFDRSVTDNLENVQIYKCFRGVEPRTSDINLRNVLLHKTQYAFNTESGSGIDVHAEHLTIRDTLRVFLTVSGNNCFLRLTNSLICNVTTNITDGILSNAVSKVEASAFASLGRGNNYLTGSTYRNGGTTNLSMTMQAILLKTTTYAPIHLTNDFVVDTVLHPLVQRDTDIPDLGYHYAPLDYLLGERNATNATLVLTNGVALGLYGTNGVILRNGSKLYSYGRPEALNTLVRYQSVQEDPTTMLGTTNVTTMSLVKVEAPGSDPEVQVRFTRANLLANTAARRNFINGYTGSELISNYRIADSQFANSRHDHRGSTNGSAMTIRWLNNVILRPVIGFYRGSGGGDFPYDMEFRNNLVRKGSASFSNHYPASTAWSVTDNLFDTSSVSTGSVTFAETGNAYYLTSPLYPGNPSNTNITTCEYVAGPLGLYYYPTNGGAGSLTDLVNAGSRSASAAGLAQHTTSATGSKDELNVDIGFHYISTHADGTPTDSDSDGVPDYLEDLDGDGGLDSGETNPGTGSDAGLKVFITKPKANLNIP